MAQNSAQPTQTAQQTGTADAPYTMSKDGLAKLTVREGLKKAYYNDQAGNCTYGVGTLVHKGDCTADDRKINITDDMIQTSLQTEIQTHSKYVRDHIGNQTLTQEQFDALVSFTYNVGDRGAKDVLDLVRSGKLDDVASTMKTYNHISVTDKKTKKVIKAISSGLTKRREEEAEPFAAKAR